ncbi:hypothetical protein SAMN05216436_105224 [bacterium A37T11]|nr:hypothetical protein SAMN05216436_105224 [bacterium A37T11]
MNPKKIENTIRGLGRNFAKTVAEYRALVLVVALIVTVALITLGKQSEIFKFPFIAGVWGGVSDWVIICVTALTAFFLYRTLKSWIFRRGKPKKYPIIAKSWLQKQHERYGILKMY